MTKRTDLIVEANALGLEFKGNISTIKLEALLKDERGDDSDSPPVEEQKIPRVKTETQETILRKRRRALIAQRKKAAMRTKIVTITNRDVRDAESATTANLSFENDYFGMGRIVPLDQQVQLEVSLIYIAQMTTMPMHRDEMKDGKRTGNKVTVLVPKYSVSYAEDQA